MWTAPQNKLDYVFDISISNLWNYSVINSEIPTHLSQKIAFSIYDAVNIDLIFTLQIKRNIIIVSL